MVLQDSCGRRLPALRGDVRRTARGPQQHQTGDMSCVLPTLRPKEAPDAELPAARM
ncbi:MAG: hypothetical protein JWO19_4890 [Bryobacterales bacterium]|jgi:hypothetical protein|nr:hypothetical protein [Bryobacterales bacterium]